MINLHKSSAYRYEATVKGIPQSLTVTKGYFAISKGLEETPLYQVSSTDVVNSSGEATVTFTIPHTALASVDPGTYTCGIKIILSDGSPVLVAESIQPLALMPPFITNVS